MHCLGVNIMVRSDHYIIQIWEFLMKKLIALISICLTFNAFALDESMEKTRLDNLKEGEYNLSVSTQGNLNKFFKGKDFVSFKYGIAAEKILSSTGLMAGVEFKGNHSSDNNTLSSLNSLDFRAGGAVVSNNGDIIAFLGTVGLRSDCESTEQGSVFVKGGELTTIENRLNLQFGTRIAFYAKKVEGHFQIVLLPMIDEYELETQIEFDLKEMGKSVEIADNIVLKSSIRANKEGSSFEGFLSLLFSINMNWGVMYYMDSDFSLEYGPEVIIDENGNPTVRFFLGFKARL